METGRQSAIQTELYDEDIVSTLVTANRDRLDLGTTTDDQIRSDIAAKLASGELSEATATEILFRLGLVHYSEGS